MSDVPVAEPITHENLRTPGKRRAPQRHTFALASVAGTIPSPNYSSRGGTAVTGVVIHTTEGITDANNLGAFFAVPARQASSHVGIDDTKTVAYVDPQFEAWTLRNGNPWTDNAELCAMAEWTREQWLAHPGMLQQAAAWVASRCHARNIPPRRITAADIKAGRRTGYFAHWDYTQATGDGTHWDVGTGFPWDTFDGLVQAAYNNNGEEFTVAQYDDIMAAIAQVRNEAWQQHRDMANYNGTLAASVLKVLTGTHTDGSDRLADIWTNDNTHDAAIEAKLDELKAALTPPAKP